MILRLVVTDGSQTPAVAESVEVSEDGAISGWRSVSEGGVGWFAGVLPSGELAELRALIDSDRPAPPSAPPPPVSGQETLELPGAEPTAIAGVSSPLATAARHLLSRLTDFPHAAVAVSHPEPTIARLSHRGTDPIRLDLSTVDWRETAWRGYYEPAGDWSGAAAGPPEVEAGPGWTFDIPIQPTDATVHLAVDLTVLSGPTRIRVRAKHTPAMA
ncbi:hypothetical protein ODJ79_36130 [Actinoplanes sp. KI2]|uniref:hypothetical protein n=1 Tax=Actinoplanes sp. KI2 TaxID=2983315 RepID=UPI0021D603F0|nr:hypothetical protein [Actinoplanes sp. KI2]MCU7729174.1 hypothetical protein [Actinoplanes sp. KI2]